MTVESLRNALAGRDGGDLVKIQVEAADRITLTGYWPELETDESSSVWLKAVTGTRTLERDFNAMSIEDGARMRELMCTLEERR